MEAALRELTASPPDPTAPVTPPALPAPAATTPSAATAAAKQQGPDALALPAAALAAASTDAGAAAALGAAAEQVATAAEAKCAASLASMWRRASRFMQAAARSPVVQSALCAVEAGGRHPQHDGSGMHGLDWTLAAMLALHLRAGYDKGGAPPCLCCRGAHTWRIPPRVGPVCADLPPLLFFFLFFFFFSSTLPTPLCCRFLAAPPFFPASAFKRALLTAQLPSSLLILFCWHSCPDACTPLENTLLRRRPRSQSP